jgi:hypothetical protein
MRANIEVNDRCWQTIETAHSATGRRPQRRRISELPGHFFTGK